MDELIAGRLPVGAGLRAWTFDVMEDRAAAAHREGGVLCIPAAEEDAPHGRAIHSGGLKVLSGHGDGMHLAANGAVYCGELVRPAAPCSASGVVCRKLPLAAEIRPVRNLDGSCLVILSCNSMNLAGQMDRSSVSLARAFIQGGGLAVIGSTRQMLATAEMARFCQEAWSLGACAADIARALNESYRFGADGYFVVYGDGSVAQVERRRAALERLETRARDGAIEIAASPLVSPSAIPRAILELAQVSGVVNPTSPRTKALAAAVSALRAAELNRLIITDTQRAAASDAQVDEREDRVAVALLEFLGELLTPEGDAIAVGDQLAPTLSALQVGPPECAEISACAHCGGRLVSHTFRGAPVAPWTALRTECAGCGVQDLALGRGDVHARVALPKCLASGQRAALLVGAEATRPQQCLVEIRHKAYRDPLVSDFFTPDGGRLWVDLPPFQESDMGSLRVVRVTNGVVYFHRRNVRMKGSSFVHQSDE